jgi:hypothetical protein
VDITARMDRNDMTDPADIEDSSEHSDNDDPTLNADANDPTDPMDKADPTEPMDSTEPRDPIDRMESCDHRDHREPGGVDPGGRFGGWCAAWFMRLLSTPARRCRRLSPGQRQMLQHHLVMTQDRDPGSLGVAGGDRLIDRLMKIQQSRRSGRRQPGRLGLGPDPVLIFV